MIRQGPVKAVCVVCGSGATYPAPGPSPSEDSGQTGLDGRPSSGEDRYPPLYECPKCDHIAPYSVAIPFPHKGLPKVARSTRAYRYMRVAALFGDKDPFQRGRFLLRAAWAEEIEGRLAPNLRRRAGDALEDALYQGTQLATQHGASSLGLAEIFRTAGDYPRALEHARRSFETRGRERVIGAFALITAAHALANDRMPLTTSDATAEWEVLSVAGRKGLWKALADACPPPPPARLRPIRKFYDHRIPVENDALGDLMLLAQDFGNARLIIDLLPRSRKAAWTGVLARPELLGDLLLAISDADTEVRMNALHCFENPLDPKHFAAAKLGDQPEVLDPLLDCLAERDWKIVSAAAVAARLIGRLEPSFKPRIRSVAKGVIFLWQNDPGTRGALERLLAAL